MIDLNLEKRLAESQARSAALRIANDKMMLMVAKASQRADGATIPAPEKMLEEQRRIRSEARAEAKNAYMIKRAMKGWPIEGELDLLPRADRIIRSGRGVVNRFPMTCALSGAYINARSTYVRNTNFGYAIDTAISAMAPYEGHDHEAHLGTSAIAPASLLDAAQVLAAIEGGWIVEIQRKQDMTKDRNESNTEKWSADNDKIKRVFGHKAKALCSPKQAARWLRLDTAGLVRIYR